MKTIESRIAPNPMEAKIWIDLSADPHGMVKKYWDGTKWVEENLKYKGLELNLAFYLHIIYLQFHFSLQAFFLLHYCLLLVLIFVMTHLITVLFLNL